MTSLSHATFDVCRNISLTLLVELLQRDSDLNLLRLWNCPQASSNKRNSSFSVPFFFFFFSFNNQTTSIINCYKTQLDQDDYALMLATVKSTNMDVYIDWYPYDAELM